jgi:predicted ATPase
MKVKSLRIQNFRSFEDVTVDFDAYTCFIGPNGSGKSNIFAALNVFFRETQGSVQDVEFLRNEDFHLKNVASPVTITVTFTDLNKEASEDFKHYVRNGQLVVSAVARFEPETEKAQVHQFGERLAMKKFASFFDAETQGKKVAELKEMYAEFRHEFQDLPLPGSKDAMIDALRQYESGHPKQCELIPSRHEFYGWSKGANLLAKYVQWVYIPAVKDASTEQIESKNTALGKLLARTVRAKINFGEALEKIKGAAQDEYNKLLGESQGVLGDISDALKTRLQDWAHPDAPLKLEWRSDSEKAIRVDEPFAQIITGENGFEGELIRFGHGLQRSYLLALLQELASIGEQGGPTLLLACEEPELYQHPPQARHWHKVLRDLSEANSQVMICTHSPYFVSGESFPCIRLVRKENSKSKAFCATYLQVSNAVSEASGEQPQEPSGVLAKIHQSLQFSLSEMFFTPRLVLVEGLEDFAYISTYLQLTNLWDKYRQHGCHIVPTDGKGNMVQALAIAKCLEIPTFVVFDSDGDKPDRNGSKEKHRKDNTAILKLCSCRTPEPFPSADFWGANVAMWASDIGSVVGNEIGPDWAMFCQQADSQFGHIGGLRKNLLHIGHSLALAWNNQKKSKSLEKLCNEIIRFAESA